MKKPGNPASKYVDLIDFYAGFEPAPNCSLDSCSFQLS